MATLATDSEFWSNPKVDRGAIGMIDRLSYLKCPKKIRSYIMRDYGNAPTVAEIQRRLTKSDECQQRWNVGEPEPSDARDFQVKSALPIAEIRTVQTATQRRRNVSFFEAAKAFNKDWLSSLPEKPKPDLMPTGTANELATAVARVFGMDLAELRTDSRRRKHVVPRALIAKLLRERNPKVYSFPRIAACVGRKDHSTVIHMIDRFPDFCREYPEVYEVYKAFGGADDY
jgi:hypothetical protein